MGNPRQRRKVRSSAHKTVKHSRHAKRNLKKMKPIRGPKLLQEAWDNKKTLRQNYATLGLVGSLKQADSGGSECPLPVPTQPYGEPSHPSSSTTTLLNETISQKYGKILRDADGKVTGIEILGEAEDDGEASEEVEDQHNGLKTELVEGTICTSLRLYRSYMTESALEKLAELSAPVRRFSSGGEITLLKKLIAKHGKNFDAMAKDRHLNTWQVCAGLVRLEYGLNAIHNIADSGPTGTSVRSNHCIFCHDTDLVLSSAGARKRDLYECASRGTKAYVSRFL
ncbi:hypothetical protein K439DRAFT_1329642 [Ramaria rubella]|nr:hypothetical protein K439DRAFT_1329642 [Ramaria rubella]